MTQKRRSAILGRWRIVKTDLWDAEYLDMLGPAHITFQANGRGEIAFGCVNVGLDCGYAGQTACFTFAGFDEMDEVSGDGAAELSDDGTIEGEICFHNGDEAQFKARRF